MERLPLKGAWADDPPPLTRKEFLQYVLRSIRSRRGLIHGTFSQGGRVCAIGATQAYVQRKHLGLIVASKALIEEVQQKNDSVPDATPAERLKMMLTWLREQIKDMPSDER